MASWEHWKNTASTKPEALALAASLGLKIPVPGQQGYGIQGGLVYVRNKTYYFSLPTSEMIEL